MGLPRKFKSGEEVELDADFVSEPEVKLDFCLKLLFSIVNILDEVYNLNI